MGQVFYQKSARIIKLIILGVVFTTSMAMADSYEPISFLDNKIARLKQEILATKKLSSKPKDLLVVKSDATRNAWLKQLYKLGIVEASSKTKEYSDKLVMAKLLESFLGEPGFKWHPKTMGLKYFLQKHKLVTVDKNILKDEAKFKKALKSEFPMGYIVKPAVGINSQGKDFYFRTNKFLQDLFKKDSHIYQSAEFSKPFVSELLKVVTSGEKFILQENVITAAGYNKILKAKEFVEIRVHSFEDKVVADANSARWKELNDNVKEEHIQKVVDYMQAFLDALPKEFSSGQAWSYDVAALDNGALRLIEINTNRGKAKQWSGYMSRPYVLGAYTRHLEKYHNLQFAGFSGFLLRNDAANILKFLRKKYIEKTQ